jgi:hypothetical protein
MTPARSARTLALAVSLVSLVSLAAGGALAALPQGLEGRFTFGDDPGERQGVDQAIEATARQLSFVVRGIARSRLRAANRIAPWVALERRGDQLVVRYEGRPAMAARADGQPVSWKDEHGATVSLQHRMEGPTLVQVLSTGEGARTNRFTAGADGSLRMAVEISSPRLPAPLRYALTYRRVPPER